MNEVVAVSSNAQTLIVTRDGTLWGCGSLNSQFGAAALETRATPIKLASDVISAFAGDSCSFFIKSDGSLWATGDNSFGQLGLTSTFVSNPTRVTGLEIRAVPTISWATPSTISAGTPLNSAQLNATASISGSFSYFPSAGTVLSTQPTRLITSRRPGRSAS
jgi:alpha-tubulin suppressor-like RCC1 family protein